MGHSAGDAIIVVALVAAFVRICISGTSRGSPAFDAGVMRRIRPRRLTPLGRVVIAVYIVIAAGTAVC